MILLIRKSRQYLRCYEYLAIAQTRCEKYIKAYGGDLEIKWSGNKNDSVFMTGPAETVFVGDVEV